MHYLLKTEELIFSNPVRLFFCFMQIGLQVCYNGVLYPFKPSDVFKQSFQSAISVISTIPLVSAIFTHFRISAYYPCLIVIAKTLK